MAPVLYEKEPELGDLIEIDRGSYQHWAVYVGNGFVVHLASQCEISSGPSGTMMSVLTEKAIVKKEELWNVAGTNKWKINNSLDKKYEPRSCHKIVNEACALEGQECPYSVITGNCEHFVTEIRYGKAESRQVHAAGEIALAAGVTAVVGFGVLALAGALFGGSKENKSKK